MSSSVDKATFVETLTAWEKDSLVVAVHWISGDKSKVISFKGHIGNVSHSELELLGIAAGCELKVRFELMEGCTFFATPQERAQLNFPDNGCLLLDLWP